MEALAELWRWFSARAAGDYSPLYRRIASGVANDPEVLALVLAAPPTGHLPPLLLASVHDLVLGGADAELAEIYAGRSDADPHPAFRRVCLAHRDAVSRRLATRRVQTNEVGRSALIGPALAWAAEGFGAPLDLIDVGCSAGLNLRCDRYRLDYGPAGSTGPASAAVRVECEVVGAAPPVRVALPPIAARIGIDLEPPDLADAADARWLLACTWPDTGRLERTRAAVDDARRDLPAVRRGDALELLPGILAAGGDGALACVVNTWSFSYFPPDDRHRYLELLAAAARRRPVVWIACDAAGVVGDAAAPGTVRASSDGAAGSPAGDTAGPAGGVAPDVMTAVVLDGSTVTAQTLGFAHSHGRWIDWRL